MTGGRIGTREIATLLIVMVVVIASSRWSVGQSMEMDEKSFGQDVEFLRGHVETVVLGESGDAQVAVVPAYQGRVMTSSARGADGTSYGWINYRYLEAGTITPHINVPGGEERFWLGPEGGQFGLFFAQGAKFVFDDWQTPAVIDTEPFEIVERDDRRISFARRATLHNWSGTEFRVKVDRQVELLSAADASNSLEADVEQLKFVGYRTTNRVTNVGELAWTPEKGLPSIWLLGMYKPGPRTTVVIPFYPGPENDRGRVVNDAYFGKVPSQRLKIADGVIYFAADGTYRSKIGVGPRRSRDICGSYDAARRVLTIVKYNKPGPGVTEYVNSMWEHQDEPYGGDVVNAYNDGPTEPGGKPLGPFYELETSSQALALKPGESGVHVQETYHFEGSTRELSELSAGLLGVSVDEIDAALE